MIGNLLGTVVNIVLDPVMILGLGWGVSGAALATFTEISQHACFTFLTMCVENPCCPFI